MDPSKSDEIKWKEVSKDNFFKEIGPQNVNPVIINGRFPYTSDFMTSSREVRGRSVGYFPKGGGLEATRYYLPNGRTK